MHQNFRIHLREQTRLDHADMDQIFSNLDIATRSDFIAFERIHLACFEAMTGVETLNKMTNRLLAEIVSGLRADLAVMQQKQPEIEVNPFGQIDPLAVDYVLGGSRMGTKVLRQRWSQSTDQNVKDANVYFNLPADPTFWRDVCDALSKIEMGSVRADKIISDTRQIFELFKSTYHHSVMIPAKAS